MWIARGTRYARPLGAVTSVLVRIRASASPVDYPVCFTNDVFAPGNTALLEAIQRRDRGGRHRIAAVVDRGAIAGQPELNVHIERYATYHREFLDLVAPPIVQGGGGSVKSDPMLPARLQSYMHALELDRKSILLVVGGASLLDLAGFAAATVRAAPRIVRLPTTTQAQAGPAVLPTNAVNAFGTKNFLGVNKPPFAVLCDRRFPESQRTRDKVFGLVGAVRAALLWDMSFFAWLAAHASKLAAGERDAVAEAVERSATLHAICGITPEDEEDTSDADPLEFGTWAADRLEMLTERRVRQGEALAVGLALDVTLGALSGAVTAKDRETIIGILERLGMRPWHDALGSVDSEGRLLLLDTLLERSFDSAPRLPLLRGIGEGVRAFDLDEDMLRKAITYLAVRDARRAHAWAFA